MGYFLSIIIGLVLYGFISSRFDPKDHPLDHAAIGVTDAFPNWLMRPLYVLVVLWRWTLWSFAYIIGPALIFFVPFYLILRHHGIELGDLWYILTGR